jgi:hypothetical protein
MNAFIVRDLQSMIIDSVNMRCENVTKDDVGSAFHQRDAKPAAHGARADNRNFHR